MIINLFLEIELGYKYFLRVGEFAVDLLTAAVAVDDLPQNDAVVVGDGHQVPVVVSHLHLTHSSSSSSNNNYTVSERH